MEESGFEDMVSYVLKSQNMFVQYIATRKILYICEKMVWRLGAWFERR